MTHDPLVTQIRAALERAPDVNLHRFPITIEHDGVVRLTGVVADIVAKRRSAQIARQIVNNGDVDDRLRIEVTRERPDRELRQAVLRHLQGDSVYEDVALREAGGSVDTEYHILIDAHDGLVRLDGVMCSLSHRRLAEVIAWWTPGVGDVDNRLHVVPPEEDSDDEIADVIRIIMDKESAVDASQIGIAVRDRKVTLRGTVLSEANRRIAAYDCWYVPGIHEVHNELSVAGA